MSSAKTAQQAADDAGALDLTIDGAAKLDADARAGATQDDEFNVRGSLTITFAHFSHDVYAAFRDPLIPIIVDKLGISLFVASLMVPAQQLPGLLQPFIGVLADRTSKRWFVVLAPAVAGISVSSIGLAPNIATVLMLLFIAGLASAAFHTPAVALSGEYGGNKMGRAMAIFMAGGSLAMAVGPLMATAAVALFTFDGIWAVMFLGIGASVALYFTVDTTESDAASRRRGNETFMPYFKVRWRYITSLLGFGLLRSMGRAPFTIFLVAYLTDIGRNEWYAAASLATISFAGMFGGFFGGILSDIVGRRIVMAASVAMVMPILYLYLFLENGSIWVISLLALAGIMAMATGPVELAMAQEIMPEARATMAGVTLAFRFTTMSLVALGFGALADAVGLQSAYWIVPALSALALIMVPFLPKRGTVMPAPVLSE